MFQLLWLVVAIPFVSAVLLALFGSRLPRRMVAMLGAGSIGFAAALTLLIGAEFIASPAGNALSSTCGWMNSGGATRSRSISILLHFSCFWSSRLLAF